MAKPIRRVAPDRRARTAVENEFVNNRTVSNRCRRKSFAVRQNPPAVLRVYSSVLSSHEVPASTSADVGTHDPDQLRRIAKMLDASLVVREWP